MSWNSYNVEILIGSKLGALVRIVLEVVKLAPVFDKKDARHEDEEQETSGASYRRHHHQVAAFVIIALFWDRIRGHAGGVRAHDKAFLEAFCWTAAFDAVVHWQWIRAGSHLLLVAGTATGVVVDFTWGPI